MEERKTVKEKINFRVDTKRGDMRTVTIGMLMDIKGLLPTDVISGITLVEDRLCGFGGYDEDEDDRPVIGYHPELIVTRERPETDEEFLKRKTEEEIIKRANKEKELKKLEEEKLEYLRLKAKFEPDK